MSNFIKGTATGVQFIDTSKETKQALAGLAKTALREAGKVVVKILKGNINTRSKRIKNHVAYWARIDFKTGQPMLDVGFQSHQRVVKRGKKPSHASPHWIELGTQPHTIKPKRAKAMGYGNEFYGKSVTHPGQRPTNVLRNAVYDNISAIKAAEEKYLAELNKKLEEAGLKINKSEEVEDD